MSTDTPAIRTSEQIDKLFPALLASRKTIKPATKSGKNTFDHYVYAKEEDWHDAIVPSLLGNGLLPAFSFPAVQDLPDRITKHGGTEYCRRVHVVLRITHALSAQWVEIDAWGEGQDRADKALYKAFTGGKKYGWSGALALPTSDDPEADEKVGQAEKPIPPRTPAAKQVSAVPPSPKPGPPSTWKECSSPNERFGYAKAALERARGDATKINTVGEFVQSHVYDLDLQQFNELCGLSAKMLVEASQAAPAGEPEL